MVKMNKLVKIANRIVPVDGTTAEGGNKAGEGTKAGEGKAGDGKKKMGLSLPSLKKGKKGGDEKKEAPASAPARGDEDKGDDATGASRAQAW